MAPGRCTDPTLTNVSFLMTLSTLLDSDRRWMQQAFDEALLAYEAGDVPVGAVVVHEGQVVGRGHNRVEADGDPTAHAEQLAIQDACRTLARKFLHDCTLYVTLEPCPMCAGALVHARINRLVFGAYDEKSGAVDTLYRIGQDDRLNHQLTVVGGLQADRSAALLRTFFAEKRG